MQDRVAVRLSLRDELDADRGAGVDEKALAEARRNGFGEQARSEIGRAARGRSEHTDGFFRVRLSDCRVRGTEERGQRCCDEFQARGHDKTPAATLDRAQLLAVSPRALDDAV